MGATTVASNISKYNKESGKDQDGQTITAYTAKTATQCADLCEGNVTCRGFVQYPASGQCWTIKGAPNKYSKNGSDLYTK
jgi:hypothetical protein